MSDSYLPSERDELFSNPDTILESTHKNELIPGEQDESLIEDENELGLEGEETSVTDGEQQTQTQIQIQNRRLNYSALKRASQNRVRPVLDENDLEESFVRGMYSFIFVFPFHITPPLSTLLSLLLIIINHQTEKVVLSTSHANSFSQGADQAANPSTKHPTTSNYYTNPPVYASPVKKRGRFSRIDSLRVRTWSKR